MGVTALLVLGAYEVAGTRLTEPASPISVSISGPAPIPPKTDSPGAKHDSEVSLSTEAPSPSPDTPTEEPANDHAPEPSPARTGDDARPSSSVDAGGDD
jgi:hypothetical protein